MSVDSILAALAVLAVFVVLLAALWLMKRRGVGFTPRVFTALGLGIALGVGMQLALGRGSDAASTALDWLSVVGQRLTSQPPRTRTLASPTGRTALRG